TPPSTRRQPQLEPDFLPGLIRLHAPGGGNRVHKIQSATASGPGARWSRVRVEHRTGIEDLDSDEVVPPDADDQGLYAAAGGFDRIRPEPGQQQLGINQDRLWQVGSDGFHDGSRLGRGSRRGWEGQFDALHGHWGIPASPTTSNLRSGPWTWPRRGRLTAMGPSGPQVRPSLGAWVGTPMPEGVMSPVDRSDLLVDNETEARPTLRSPRCLPAANEGMDRSTCRAASDTPHRTGKDRTRASP